MLHPFAPCAERIKIHAGKDSAMQKVERKKVSSPVGLPSQNTQGFRWKHQITFRVLNSAFPCFQVKYLHFEGEYGVQSHHLCA